MTIPAVIVATISTSALSIFFHLNAIRERECTRAKPTEPRKGK